MSEELVLEEVCRSLETEQERLDRQGIYGEIKRELVKRGIPAEEIAFIHDFDTPAQKARAFADANAGKIRVMIASTEKAGAGTNMQQRLAALHHLDAPWRPSDVEQREGRILRPNNRFSEVRIFNYVTEGSFDGYIWQTLENKARFISQIMSGEVTARTTEDVDDMVMTAAQVKAIASGNPRILERVSIEVELTRLSRLHTVWRNSRRHLKSELNSLPERVREADLCVMCHSQAVAVRNEHRSAAGDGTFTIELRLSLDSPQSISFDERAQAGAHLGKLHHEVRVNNSSGIFTLGSYLGFQILAQRQRKHEEAIFIPLEGFLSLPEKKLLYSFNFGESAQGTIQSIDAQLRGLDSHLERALKTQAELKHKQEQVEQELMKGWEYAQRYEELRAQFERVNQSLKDDGPQLDEKREFVVLDYDAFQSCVRSDDRSLQLSEDPSVTDKVVTTETHLSAIATSTTAPAIAAESDRQQATPPVIIEEQSPTCLQITLDDLRNQPKQKPKRQPESASSANQSTQMSLW
ncbi:MAG: helicase C-terminal domain-containing protein [Acidobacteria bacterium]|nr:helicase C-terminal domain-containing protein [Acidobacteriota bacterium]